MSYAGQDHEFDPKPLEREDQNESPREPQVRDIVHNKATFPSSLNKMDRTVLGATYARASASLPLPLGKLLRP